VQQRPAIPLDPTAVVQVEAKELLTRITLKTDRQRQRLAKLLFPVFQDFVHSLLGRRLALAPDEYCERLSFQQKVPEQVTTDLTGRSRKKNVITHLARFAK
jgi:hypothetical protein